MSVIADIVRLKTGYANFVELKSAFEASKENADRMAMYRPTKAHRKAFERICRGLYQPNDKKFYLLSGSYGTGKSHLCLMLANVLSRSSGDPEIKGFYENYEKLDAEQGKMLRNVRKSGQYLVALCDYHSGKRFEDVLLKAILDAAKTAGLDTGVVTEFDEAERVLEDWEKKGSRGIRNFLADFEKALAMVAPGMSAGQLRSSLKQIDSAALVHFRSAFKEVMGGREFQAESGNLIPIVKSIIKHKKFQERFKGIAIFFDEFGYTLEKHAYSTDILHGFMEEVCQREANVVFTGCIHKDFKAYADRLSQADVAVLDARKTDVPLANEGIEEIIGAIVEVEKKSKVWEKDVEPKLGVFDQFLPTCKALKLFPWIADQERIREKVLEDIYGMHPAALACLLRLSSEIGSDARSTFTFFSGDVGGAEGSYANFIKNAEITVSGSKLNLYRVARLFDFFNKELSLKNPDLRDRQRQLINGYYASEDAVHKALKDELIKDESDERLDVLKTVLLYQLCTPAISTSLENIKFGMYCIGKVEEKQVETHLKYLTKVGALFVRPQSDTYELAIGSGDDPIMLIERYRKDTKLHPVDMLAAFLEEAPDHDELEYLEAKQYNLHFSEDKRFFRRFALAKDIGPDLWNRLHQEWEQSQGKDKKSAEGVVVYVICEDDAALQMARNASKSVPYDNMALAIPIAPQPFTDMVLDVKACRHYLPPNEAEKISAQTEARLRDIFEDPKDGYLTKLQKALGDILSGEKAIWYGKNGKVVVDQPKQPHEPVNRLCDELFKKRCRIKHPDLNIKHDDKWESRNTALRQAVNMLLQGETVQIDNGNPDNHGEKRYLEKVLFKGAGALIKTGTDDSVSHFECEADPVKISEDFPLLKELCRRFSEQKAGEMLVVADFIREAKQSPYGCGSTCIALSLAHGIRAFGERLRVFSDSTKTAEEHIANFDNIVEIVSSPSKKVVLEVQTISPVQIKLIEGFAHAVHAPALKHGEKRTLHSTHSSLREWWQSSVPEVARITDLYGKTAQKRIAGLRNAFGQVAGVDRFQFVLDVLPAVYTDDPIGSLKDKEADIILKDFTADAKLLETGITRAKNQLADSVCKVFGRKGGDSKECQQAVAGWYESLNPNQQDFSQYEDEEPSQLVKLLADKETEFEDKLTVRIPSAFGFGPVRIWTALRFDEYAAKLKAAKKVIDDAKVKVPRINAPPEIKIKPGDELKVEKPDGVKEFIYTIDGEDPKASETAMRIREVAGIGSEVKDRPCVVIKIRTVDAEGNFGDLQEIKLVNSDREYDVNVERGIFESEGHFKFPEDDYALVLVLQSIVTEAEKRKIIDKKRGEQLKSAVSKISDKTSYHQ